MSKRLHSDPLEWIGEEEKETPINEKPKIKKTEKEKKKQDSRRKGLKDGWIRASLVLREEHLEKLKSFAWWERISSRDVLEMALEEYFKDKEVKPIPKDRRGK